jgi:hypothetical protein
MGEGSFRFEVIRLCTTKSEMSFGEVEEQFRRGVLTSKLSNGQFEFLNENIASRWFRARITKS